LGGKNLLFVGAKPSWQNIPLPYLQSGMFVYWLTLPNGFHSASVDSGHLTVPFLPDFILGLRWQMQPIMDCAAAVS
jgi:hypothetical protein